MAEGEGSGSGRAGPLDGDARLADRLGEGAHVAVVAVAAAVEDRLGDAGRLGPLGQQLAGSLRAALPSERSSGSNQATAASVRADVVDQLRGQAAVGAEDGDARARGGAGDLRAHPAATFEPAVAP